MATYKAICDECGKEFGGATKEDAIKRLSGHVNKTKHTTEQKAIQTHAPCECGCGGIPAGRKSRFLPGHDAKHYSALKKQEPVADPV